MFLGGDTRESDPDVVDALGENDRLLVLKVEKLLRKWPGQNSA